MVFKRFSTQVTVRVLLILVTIVIFSQIFGDERLLFNQIILVTVILFQILELIRYTNTTNRELTKFFQAIKQSDFTQNFSRQSMGRSYEGLFLSMQELVEAYKAVKIEREAQYHLLETIMKNIPVGVIVVSDKNSINNMNESARKILEVPEMHSWKLLQNRVPEFTQYISDEDVSGSFLIELKNVSHPKSLSVNMNRFELLEKKMRLITFMDIKSQLEQKEVEAWHRLIRILTHEIMNSVTPISSMAETVEMMLESNRGKNLTDDLDEDLIFSVKTIQKRSDGLLQFVEDYRKLTRTPKPDKKEEKVLEMVNGIQKLFESDLNKEGVSFKTVISEDEEINMDRKLVEQVLINLIKNSREALSGTEKPEIKVSTNGNGEYKTISIEDNGPGIQKDILQDIWVPFYTTKEKGSGIGLSLSKQIMKLHNGDLKVETDGENYTRFVLEFPIN